MYYFCDMVTVANTCFLFNELDGGSGGADIASASHYYHSENRSGAEGCISWADDTNAHV